MNSFTALNGKVGTQFELNYDDKNTSLHVSLRTRKFDKKIHYCCRKIYKRDTPFRVVFEVKTLAVLFPPYPSEMKTNTGNLNLSPFWRLFVSMEIEQPIPTRALSCARGLSMRTHLTAVDSALKMTTRYIFKNKCLRCKKQ